VTREHAPRPGATWEVTVHQVETVVPDDDEPARPNRAARRRTNRKATPMSHATPGRRASAREAQKREDHSE
jgi:hypothetical protein